MKYLSLCIIILLDWSKTKLVSWFLKTVKSSLLLMCFEPFKWTSFKLLSKNKSRLSLIETRKTVSLNSFSLLMVEYWNGTIIRSGVKIPQPVFCLAMAVPFSNFSVKSKFTSNKLSPFWSIKFHSAFSNST